MTAPIEISIDVQQENTAAQIQAFKIAKLNYKDAKDTMKAIKKDFLDDDHDLKEFKKSLIEIKKEVAIRMEELEKELATQSDYQTARKEVVVREEEFAHHSEALIVALEKLPPKPVQMTLQFDDGEAKITVLNRKQLFINGKDQKL